MPVYEYNCDNCGIFAELRNISQSSAPAHCPKCGLMARKIFSSINLRAMRPENRKAWERNERNAHEPHVCGSGCSHGASKSAQKKTKSGRPVLQYSNKRTSRPWMLGH